MGDGPLGLETRVDELNQRLTDVEARLGRLEAVRAHRLMLLPERADPTLRPAADVAKALVPDVGSGVTLLGRTLFILAGAFLLRALTDSGRLSVGLGGLLGLLYATTWIVWADWSGGRGQRTSAVFHGLAFVLIAFPLLFELTVRFHLLGAGAAATAIALCAAASLLVVWRRSLRTLAWIAASGVVATAVGLMFALAEVGPFALVVVALGVAAVWFGYVFEWTFLRWPIALVADLAVLVLSFRAVAPGVADEPAVAFGAQAMLLVAYLGTFATRTLLLNRDVIPFEVTQTAAAAAVGLGGAARVTASIGGGVPLGLTTLALAIGCYAAAAIFVERRQSRRRNYYVYTTAGLVFALVGVLLSLPTVVAGLTYGVFGIVAAMAGRLSSHVTYRAHGATFFVGAAVVTGLLPHVLYGLGVPVVPTAMFALAMGLVLAQCALAFWGLGYPAGVIVRPAQRVPRLIVVALVLGGALAWVVGGSAARRFGVDSPDVVATLRTSLLVAVILGLALASRALAFVEGGWLVYPLLAMTGLKFLIEDVGTGRPATLMFSFALYGVALFVGPRLIRRPAAPAGART